MPTSRRCGGRAATSAPSIRIVPSSGASNPAIRFRTVVLPQPDGPRRVMSSPGSTSSVRRSTAVTAPNRLVRSVRPRRAPSRLAGLGRLATPRRPTARSRPRRRRRDPAVAVVSRPPGRGEPRHHAEEAERDDHLERRDGGQERIELVLRDRAPHLPRQRRGGGAADEQRDHDLVEGHDRREERARQHAAPHERAASPARAPATPSRPGSGPRARAGDRARAPPPRRSARRRARPASRGRAPARRACRPRPTAANPA